MNTIETGLVSNVDRLAAYMERDIRHRRLAAGEKYMTAVEAGKMLGVSTASADRAMQVLCSREMLLRRRSLGTFVGPHFKMAQKTTTRTLYVIFPDERIAFVNDMLALNPFITGLRSRFHDANVQVSFPPANDPRSYVSQLLNSRGLMVNVAGFVPVTCPPDVYRRLADSGIPTVVFGTPYYDQQDIASVDVDDNSSGRLLAEYLTWAGHRRIALFTLFDGRPGDNHFHDGISDALTAASLPQNSLIPRMVHQDPSGVAGELNRVLTLADVPTALIVRSSAMANLAAMALEQLEVPPAQKFEIVCQAEWTEAAIQQEFFPFTHTRSLVSIEDMAGQIVYMLEELAEGKQASDLEDTHVVFPVELCRVT